MFTSNFARLKRIRLERPNLRPISIAVGSPRWYKVEREPLLAPTRAKLEMERDEYDRHYDSILAKLDPQEIVQKWGPAALFLCWESPNTYCHRRRVAEWLEQALGIVVPEFGFPRDVILPYRDLPASPSCNRRKRQRQR